MKVHCYMGSPKVTLAKRLEIQHCLEYQSETKTDRASDLMKTRNLHLNKTMKINR